MKVRLTSRVAQERIRSSAKVSSNIILGTHAKQQMASREIFRQDVDRTLSAGYIDGDPEPTEYGEWKCKMILPIKGRRDLGVIVILLRGNKLFVKTAEWEDPK